MKSKFITLRSFILFSLLIVLSIQPALTQQTHTCSAKERYLRNTRMQGHKSLKSTVNYDVHFYKLDLTIENNSTYIEGSGSVAAVTTTAISVFELELHNTFNIDSVMVNGSKESFTHINNIISINLGATIPVASNLFVEVYYKGTAPSGGSAAIGDGFSTDTSGAWGNLATWSLSEPYAAYEWFPVKQVLTDKADSSEVWITTSASNMAGSNGLLKNVTNLPNNKKRYEWKSNYPIAYYLISVAVAEYIDYTIYAHPSGWNDSIPIVNYIYNNPATLPNFKDEIDKTADMLELFSEKFGIYPFYLEKYGHCMTPFSGGMEHQTMTSQGFFVTDLTSHELGHQWFGDQVTCASWRDIWINEGFASYSEYIYIEEKEPSRGQFWLANTENSALSSPTGSVYVDDTTNVGRIFSSSLSYNKGAFLLHMLRFEINNDSIFYKGLRDFSTQYAMSNARGIDFQKVMENASGLDFNVFFDQWYFGEGFPTFNVKWNQDVSKNLDLRIEENVSAPPVTPMFVTHLDIGVSRFLKSDTNIRVLIDKNVTEIKIPNVHGVVNNIVVDPNNWVLNQTGNVERDPNLSIGIKEQERDKELNIYPNPAKGAVFLDIPSGIIGSSVKIMDESGRLVYSESDISGTVISINTRGWARGSYLILLNNSTSVYKGRFSLY